MEPRSPARCWALLDYGNVQVFMDVHDIEPGRGWQERLEKGIEDGAAMLAIVADRSSEHIGVGESCASFGCLYSIRKAGILVASPCLCPGCFERKSHARDV